MINQKPNHLCKNMNCKKGIDGKPMEYWACNDCSKINSYREVACCPECFKEYITQVLDARNECTNKINKEDVENVATVENAIVGEKVMAKKYNKNKSHNKISEENE